MTYFNYLKKKWPQTLRNLGELSFGLSLGSLIFGVGDQVFSFKCIPALSMAVYLAVSIFFGAWVLKKNDEWQQVEE